MQEKGPENKPDIRFKPITPGLGFHPFADGLPYAPVAKTPAGGGGGASAASTGTGSGDAMGTGAVAAGPPTMVPPKKRLSSPMPPRVTVPTAPLRSTKAAFRSEIQPASEGTTHPFPSCNHFGFSYLTKRVFAYLLDCFVNITFCASALGFVFWVQGLDLALLMNVGLAFFLLLFFLVFNWALITAQEVAFGTSLGKRSFGLALNGTAGLVFWRAFFFLISTGFLGLGLIWAVFKKNKRCWHDIAVDLQPTELAHL